MSGVFSRVGVFADSRYLLRGRGGSGSLADRISTRRVVCAGIISRALDFFLANLASGSLQWFLLWFCSLVGLGVGLVYVPTVAAVQRWFIKHRSKASGIALAGTGVGTFVGPIAAGLLMQHYSWETTMQFFAATILVVGLLVAFLVRSSPHALGLLPDGLDASSVCAEHQGTPAGMRLGRSGHHGAILVVLRGDFLWLGRAVSGAGAHQSLRPPVWFVRHRGQSVDWSDRRGQRRCRLFLGSIGDRMGACRLLIVLTFALMLLNLLWLGAHTFATLALFAVANGGCISLYLSVTASWFGTANPGAILGALYISVGIAALIGGSVAGLLFDLYQNYTASLLLGALCALLSVGFILIAGRQRPRFTVEAQLSR